MRHVSINQPNSAPVFFGEIVFTEQQEQGEKMGFYTVPQPVVLES